MNIVPLLLFCSLALVVGSIVLFVFSAKQGDCSEADRLCLMPLEDDTGVDAGIVPEAAAEADAGEPSSPSRGND